MNKTLAFLVHIFTALGAGFALLAMLAAAEKNWSDMFLWLFAAQVVDGIDGPLARKFKVREHLPNWSGDSLDYVIDYSTYVLIPAFALAHSGFMGDTLGIVAAMIIAISAGIYFADDRMKTDSNAFRGFPAVWNGVLFYYVLLMPDPVLGFALLVLLAAAQFVPVEFVHPVRVASWRPVTLAISAVWAIFALRFILNDMNATSLDKTMLVITGLYIFAIGPILHYLRTRSRLNT